MDIASYRSSTDDELAAAVANGDRAAFAEIYDRLAPRVLGRVMAEIADTRLAEELVFHTFVEFWRQAPRIDRSRGSAAAWLFTAARARPVGPETAVA
jgi:RNA polymerase sigma-70 factor (ECF subfamily)